MKSVIANKTDSNIKDGKFNVLVNHSKCNEKDKDGLFTLGTDKILEIAPTEKLESVNAYILIY